MRHAPERFFIMPDVAFLIGGLGFSSIVFAFIMQYGFGVKPCELCLMQRIPFAAATALCAVAICFPRQKSIAKIVLSLCALLFLGNTFLAIFHSGVERHWWDFHSACTGAALPDGQSVEALRQQLLATPTVRCDEISWSLLGLTMANLNIVVSMVLAAFSLEAAIHQFHKPSSAVPTP